MPHEHADDLDLGHRLADTAAAVSLAYFRRDYRQWQAQRRALPLVEE